MGKRDRRVSDCGNEEAFPGVKILNPWDSQGNQIADAVGGVYPTLRGCGGAGYQQGYLFDRREVNDEQQTEG